MIADDDQQATIPDFDRRAATAAGFGQPDFFVLSHDAAPVITDDVIVALRTLEEHLHSANGGSVVNGTTSDAAKNGHVNGHEPADSDDPS
jgi:hypothetical protein